MQERVRAVEFVLGRAGLAPAATAERSKDTGDRSVERSPTPAFDALRAVIGGARVS